MTTAAPARNYDADPVSPELRARYAANNIRVLWESENGALPDADEQAHHWPWQTIRPIMLETAKITLPAIIERRVMQLANPTSTNAASEAASGLINAGIQALMPGEHARPHRHSMHALRFILEGHGAETIVEGKACAMEPGDLVTTPGWTWHEHRNVAGAPTIWVDILDATLHRALGTAKFQPGPISDPRRPLADAAFTSGAFVPVAARADPLPYSPVFRYPWPDAKRAVDAAPPAADGSRMIRYADPVTGGPVLPTIDCYLQRIEPGEATVVATSNASAVCIVVAGEGRSTIGAETIDWQAHDLFTVPSNSPAHHRCSDDPAYLFIATDREIYYRLGLLAERSGPA